VSDWLTTVTAAIEATDYDAHAATAWEVSPTRLYVVRGERRPLLAAEASNMYATVDVIAGLLTSRSPVTADAVVVVSTADAHDPDTGSHIGRIRVAYGLTRDRRTSVIRRRSDSDTQIVTGAATGEFPDAIDAALRDDR
jgi:hypothetical protein